MSGSRIVDFCNAWATDHAVDTPHASYPFSAGNKRTALLENLGAFPPEVQYQMLLDLCDLSGPNRSEVQEIRLKLIERFSGNLGSKNTEPSTQDPSVLQFMGISGSASYRNSSLASPLRRPSIFICHASEDKATARHLYKQLKSDGYLPWLDEEDLLPGQDWEMEIRRAVQRSDVVLVCLSARSIGKSGYVQKEIKIALDAADERPDGAIYIIPARIQECQIPGRLSKLHWVDTFASNGYERLCLSLNSINLS